MHYRRRRRSLSDLAKAGRGTLYVVTTKSFGLKFSNPKETSWIVAIFFLALSLLLPSRLLLPVFYLPR
jgi:hypothetical protein